MSTLMAPSLEKPNKLLVNKVLNVYNAAAADSDNDAGIFMCSIS